MYARSDPDKSRSIRHAYMSYIEQGAVFRLRPTTTFPFVCMTLSLCARRLIPDILETGHSPISIGKEFRMSDINRPRFGLIFKLTLIGALLLGLVATTAIPALAGPLAAKKTSRLAYHDEWR